MHNTFIFRSAPSPEDASIEEIRKVCDLLTKQGELRVAYRLDAPNKVSEDDMVVDLSIRALKFRTEPFGVVVDVGTPTVVGREFNSNFLDVHVTLESDVVRFDEAPWIHQPARDSRLIEMAKRGRPFIVSYTFAHSTPSSIVNTCFEAIIRSSSRAIHEAGIPAKAELARLEFVGVELGSSCRIDVRIVPDMTSAEPPTWENLKPEGGRLVLMSRDHDRDHYSPAVPGEVERILDKFESGGYWSMVFHASVEDARRALSGLDIATAFIRGWLEAHGMKNPDVELLSCDGARDLPDQLVVGFKKRQK